VNAGPHPVVLRSPRFLGGGPQPAVLRLTQQRAIPMLLEQLQHAELRERLRDKLIPADDPTLYLPVHRTFNVVLAEAWCDVPGQPRIDPSTINGAGLVIRRRLPRSGQYAPPERWLTEPGAVLGWRSTSELDDDPEAARRAQPTSGSKAVDRALAARRGLQPQVSESITRLYVLPPAICEAVGATLLFGIVQAATSERAQPGGLSSQGDETPATAPGASYSPAEIRSQIPGWLRHSRTPREVPETLAGKTFRVVASGPNGRLIQVWTGSEWDDFDAPAPWRPLSEPVHDSTLTSDRHFMRMLSQLRLQWDVWGPGSNPLRATLEGIDAEGGTLSSVLQDAADVFVLRQIGSRVRIPRTWPLIPRSTGQATESAVGSVMQAQLDKVVQNEGRFDRPKARYTLRAFARIRRHDGCPPDLVWSQDSRLLRVARWFEGPPDGVVKPTIELPTLAGLARIKPNVNIRVPRDIFNFLQNNDPKDFIAGEAKDDSSGPDLMWICTFNFAIIFVIAFMILINFVFLLNFIFWWVPFFRICIPLPAGLFAEEEA